MQIKYNKGMTWQKKELAIDKIMEHYNFQSLDGKETVLTEEDFDKICETIKKSLHSEKCVDLY